MSSSRRRPGRPDGSPRGRPDGRCAILFSVLDTSVAADGVFAMIGIAAVVSTEDTLVVVLADLCGGVQGIAGTAR